MQERRVQIRVALNGPFPHCRNRWYMVGQQRKESGLQLGSGLSAFHPDTNNT